MLIRITLPGSVPRPFETGSEAIVFGRKSGGGLHLDVDLLEDEYVSRHHARLFRRGKEVWIEDLGSANGTWVNDELIQEPRRVDCGDRIRIGWTLVVLQADEGVETADDDPAAATRIWLGAVPMAAVDPSAATQIGFGDAPGAADAGAVTSIGAALESSPRGGAGPCPSVSGKRPAGDVRAPVSAPRRRADLRGAASGRSRSRREPSLSPPPPPPAALDAVESEMETGGIVDVRDMTQHPLVFAASGSYEDVSVQVWRQLCAFNELCLELGTVESFDVLIQVLVARLREVIPNAQRGALLMPDERGELLLKAHWPTGQHSVSMTWVRRAYVEREAFVWAAPAKDVENSDTPQSALYYQVQSAIYVPLQVGGDVLGVIYADNQLTRDAFYIADLELLRAIAAKVSVFIRDHMLRSTLRREDVLLERLSQQFPPKIARLLAQRYGRRQIGGERVDPATILVSDVRGFTRLSMSMDPDDVVRMLNEMFDAVVPIVLEHDGVVDKFVGDSVLAVFGSPEPDDRQWEKAVKAALEMQDAVSKLGESRRVRRLPLFQIGVSVHTGEVIHGFIGSCRRMEYTIIGDAVNRASRYCDGAGPGEVLISPAVYERVYGLVEVDTKTIRTKHEDTEPDLEAYVVRRLKSRHPSGG